jgi:hypothetical protein
MITVTDYIEGADLPDLAFSWRDRNGALIDFSSYSFELKIGFPGETALVTKTTGIAGFATDPNVIIAFLTTGELNALQAGNYRGQLKAQRAADGKQRYLMFNLAIGSRIL